MKNATTSFTLFFLALTCWACKDHFTAPLPVYDNYSNLEVGNYWIYDIFTLKADGTLIPQNKVDSVYIAKDTLIGTNTYFKYLYPDFPSKLYTHKYLRDSLHYIVDHQGKILFSSENFTDVLFSTIKLLGPPPADTLCFITAQMTDENYSMSVPAGLFTTKNYKTTYQMHGKWTLNGTFRPVNVRYAKEVGIVEETLPFFIGDPNYTVRRLKRYGHQ
jgi:hypothetical protein